MPTHHNRRLFDLAQRNAQRLALNQFCLKNAATLPAFCHQAQQAIFHPDTPAEIGLAYARNAQAHQTVPEGQIAACCKLQTTSHRRALAWLALEVPQLPEDDYLVTLGEGHQFTFDSQPVWIASLPVFQLRQAALIQSLDGLLAQEFTELAFVGMRTSAALVLDSYMGNLEHEPSDEEMIYELSRLGGDSRC